MNSPNPRQTAEAGFAGVVLYQNDLLPIAVLEVSTKVPNLLPSDRRNDLTLLKSIVLGTGLDCFYSVLINQGVPATKRVFAAELPQKVLIYAVSWEPLQRE